MPMDDLKRNGSGYYDPTAYEAIINVEKENGRMKRGEIWEVEYQGTYKNAVVISAQERFCNVLMLNDEMKTEQDVQVRSRSILYTHPAMLSYKFNDGFAQFIRTMEDDEFESLLDCITEKLGIQNDCRNCNMESAQVNVLREKLQQAERRADALQEENEQLRRQTTEAKTYTVEAPNIIVLTTQRDMYKQQYEELLERLIEK